MRIFKFILALPLVLVGLILLAILTPLALWVATAWSVSEKKWLKLNWLSR